VDNLESEKNLFNKKALFKYAIQGAIVAAVVGAVIFFITLSTDTWVELKNVDLRYIVLLSFMIILAWFCNGTRIYLLTHSINHNISFRSAMAISVSTEFGVSASPGGVGGTAVRLGLLVKSGLDLPRSTALFAADVFVDCLYFVIIMPLAVFIILTDPTWNSSFQGMGKLPYIVLGYMIAVIVIVVLAIRNRKKVNVFIHVLLKKYGHKRRLSGRWRVVTGNFSKNINASWGAVIFLWRNKRIVLICNFFLSAIQLTCRYSTLPILLIAFSCDKNPFPLFFIQGVVFLLSAMLVVPGGGGASEIITSLILPVFVQKSLIGVIVLLWRIYTYYFYLFVGGGVFSYTINHLNKLKPIDKKNDN
jgi:uncharacterized protein (TIRG00374 family)